MRRSIRPCACGAAAISPELPAYERFLQDLARNRNLTRQAGFQEEQAALRPLPRLPLAPCREFRVSVSRFSTWNARRFSGSGLVAQRRK